MGKVKLLTRDAILQANDLPYEDVEVPEWGGVVRVRTLTGKERDTFEESISQVKGKKTELRLANVRAKLAARAIVDENGNRLFSDDDISALGKKSAAALDRVFTVARRLSGFTDEDMEELVGNSERDQSDGSTSD